MHGCACDFSLALAETSAWKTLGLREARARGGRGVGINKREERSD